MFITSFRPTRFCVLLLPLCGLSLVGCSGSGSSSAFSRPTPRPTPQPTPQPTTQPQGTFLTIVQNQGADLGVPTLQPLEGGARPVRTPFGIAPFVADVAFASPNDATLSFIAQHSADGGLPETGDVFNLATDGDRASCTYFRGLTGNFRGVSGTMKVDSVSGNDYVFSFTNVRFIADPNVPNNPTVGTFTISGRLKVTLVSQGF